MRKILWIAAGLVILVVAALTIFGSQSDKIIKAAVETYGPTFTGSKVTLSNVDISIFGGSASLQGFAVDNPQGFKTPTAFQVDEMRVRLDTATLLEDVIVIHEVVIDGPQITYEMADGTNNFEVLQSNVRNAIGPVGEEEPETADVKKIIIEDLVITNGKMTVAGGLMGGKGTSINLPDIHLTNIGLESGGTSMGEATQLIVSRLYGSVLKGLTVAKAEGLLGDALKIPGDLGETVGDVGKGIGDAVGSTLGDVGEGVSKGIKGLFGK